MQCLGQNFPLSPIESSPRRLLGLAESCPLVRLLKFVLQISYVLAPLPVIVRLSAAYWHRVGGHAGFETSGCVHPEIRDIIDLLGQEVRGTLQHADLPRSTNPAVALEILFQRPITPRLLEKGGSPDVNSHHSWSRFLGFGPNLVSSVMLIFLKPPRSTPTYKRSLLICRSRSHLKEVV
jgi:hypothetical protein